MGIPAANKLGEGAELIAFMGVNVIVGVRGDDQFIGWTSLDKDGSDCLLEKA